MKGTILNGKKGSYAIRSYAGEGGVGTVYKARDISDGLIVAAKLLHSKRFPLTDVQRKRFHQEIEASSRIKSEYIVAGFDSGIYDDEPFLVLDWMSGGTLQEFIPKRGYDADIVVSFTCQLLKAFRDLRRLGLIHRDIKPNNVMLDAAGRLKLSDLGIARDNSISQYLTATEERLGSLLYISERQRFNPESVTCRDDFYSLCLVLYELISGRRVHTRNVSLKYLRPTCAPMALSVLIDRGVEDTDEWEMVHDELCAYLDIDAERISVEYTGSVIVPESLLRPRVQEVVSRLAELKLTPPPLLAKSQDTILKSIVLTIKQSYDDCSLEFEDCGVWSWMNREIEMEGASRVVYFGADFSDEIESLLEDTGIDEFVRDGRLFSWIEFESTDDGGFQIAGISGKRLYADISYLPDDTFDRPIVLINDPTKHFLRKVGRALAIGAAIGALERICDELAKINSKQGRGIDDSSSCGGVYT